MSHVLVVDDEPSICWGFRELLTGEGHDVASAASAEEAIELAGCRRPDVVVLDVRLPGMDGLSALRQLRECIGDAPVVVITAFGDLRTAVDAVQLGAFDYLTKPFDLDRAADVVRRALQSVTRPTESPSPPTSVENELLIGTSAHMQDVFKQIALAASADVPVLVTGESGTGKELVARAVHAHSPRRSGPFIAVCPAALSPTVVESELFGHVRGAFTGAERDRAGLLEVAAGGTVLLDEIGDLPLSLQVKLLRALEQREITPVGGAQPRPTDFRIVAATHRPLAELIRRGAFREDLYFRLSVFQIELPPLRARRADIPLLANLFLQRLGSPFDRKRFTSAAIDDLQSRRWRGNVRELKNAVERAAILARGETIEPMHLPRPDVPGERTPSSTSDALKRLVARWARDCLTGQHADTSAPNLHEAFLKVVEPSLLEWALRRSRQNRTAAARLLGLNRATLRDKLRRHGIGE